MHDPFGIAGGCRGYIQFRRESAKQMKSKKGLKVMKKVLAQAFAFLVITQAPVAFAGFVDETAVAPVVDARPVAQRRALQISAAYESPLWDKPIAPQAGRVSLGMALAMLLPPDLPGVSMAPDPMIDTLQVSWDTGLTRRQALGRVVPAGMVLVIEDGRARLARTAEAFPVPAIAGMPQGVVAPVQAPRVNFAANSSDKTVRQTVSRWSKAAGWSFEDGYWDLPRDVPVVAAAVFGADFKESVLALLQTTEVTDLPAKPCFYTNKVVRVVNKAEKCDKTKE